MPPSSFSLKDTPESKKSTTCYRGDTDTMPKLKTNSGASKRFTVTKNGKVKRAKANASHLLTHKSSKRKRSLRKSSLIAKVDQKNVRRLLPYA
jgi:large subunit ribosomal protein L35